MSKSSSEEINRALHEWMSALDVLKEPIFLHDEAFRVIRCNNAYRQFANLPFEKIIGKPYFEVFPIRDGPMPQCRQAKEESPIASGEDEIMVGDTLFRSRAYTINDENGHYRYSIHIFEDITDQRHFEQQLSDNEAFMTAILDNLPIGIAVNTVHPDVSFTYMNDNFPKIYRTKKEALKDQDTFWNTVYEDPEFRKSIRQRVLEDTNSGDTARMKWNDIPIKRTGEETTYISAQNIPMPNHDAYISMVWDVTQRKRTENMLTHEKQFSEKLIQSLPDLFFLIDHDGRLRKWNKKYEQTFGKTKQQLQDFNALSVIHADDLPQIITKMEEAYSQGSATAEARLHTVNGLHHYALTAQRIATAYGNNLIGIGIDITEQKNSEIQMRKARDFSDKLIEMAPVIILTLDTQGRIVRTNSYLEQLTGYTFETLKGKVWFDIFLPKQNRKKTEALFAKAILGTQTLHNLNPILTRDGKLLQIEWSDKILKNDRGEPEGLLCIGMNVTAQRKTQERLELFHTLFEQSMDAVEIIDPKTFRLIDVNATECRQLGYSREELLKMSIYDIDPTMTGEHTKKIASSLNTTDDARFEGTHRRRDGSTFPVEISISLVTVDKPYLLAIVRDITDRKRAEKTLSRAIRALNTISETNLSLVRAGSEKVLLQNAVKIIVQNGGYDLAVVDFARDKEQLEPIVWAGYKGKHYWVQKLSWGDAAEGNFPAGSAVRSGETQICRNIQSSDTYAMWKDAAAKEGYVSNIAFPLLKDGKAFGALSIYSTELQLFDEDEVLLLEQLANDLAYGIINLRTRIAHQQHEELLRESLEQSIQAIAATVESRDPYTAGHQKRVAELATAIAEEMHLSKAQIEGIGFAGIIHDLGKIHIPAEILSKPGELTDLEYQLIQTHPEAGYDIVKDIKFPWPIAQIILQHHERLDGSGYPKGLKGDAILLEARIIAIADTVDAISSHRPYRSARGLDTALSELKNGRGTLFDPDAVDACIRLLNEKAFEFTMESPLRVLQ